jgi:hypothetical protein
MSRDNLLLRSYFRGAFLFVHRKLSSYATLETVKKY